MCVERGVRRKIFGHIVKKKPCLLVRECAAAASQPASQPTHKLHTETKWSSDCALCTPRGLHRAVVAGPRGWRRVAVDVGEGVDPARIAVPLLQLCRREGTRHE